MIHVDPEQTAPDRPEPNLHRRGEVWSIRTRLQAAGAVRELALLDLAIASKLRGCDLVAIEVIDIGWPGTVCERGAIIQKKTGRPVRFKIT